MSTMVNECYDCKSKVAFASEIKSIFSLKTVKWVELIDHNNIVIAFCPKLIFSFIHSNIFDCFSKIKLRSAVKTVSVHESLLDGNEIYCISKT